MFRGCLSLLTWFSVVCAAHAHEFWIEPTERPNLSGEQVLEVRVLVGEGFRGTVYPFEPRAYAAAYWIGPQRTEALHAQPLSNRDVSLDVQGDGLHTLAVTSFGIELVHETVQDFLAFAQEIGAEQKVAETQPVTDDKGGVREKYRRFSKLLVRYGEAKTQDKRHGFAYEWVKSAGGLTLYADGNVAKDQPIDLFCRFSDGKVIHERLRTDTSGLVPYMSKVPNRCMVNAVFLRPSASGRDWSSDWVSMTWDPQHW